MTRSARSRPAVAFPAAPLLALALLAAGGGAGPAAADPADPPETPMKITLTLAGETLSATLEDGAAARDFAALLPLSLTLTDYHATEKVADLPRALSTEGAPEGVDPQVGDIAYFAPWGNLAIFHRDFGYSRGLIRLGRIEGDLGALAGEGSVEVRLERAEAPD